MRGLRYAWAIAVLSLCGIIPPPARAAVTPTGDIFDFGYASSFYAGYHENTVGTVVIDAGSVFNRQGGYLGYGTDSTGTAVVTGAGSQWSGLLGGFSVGHSGSGTLRIEAGGQVITYSGSLGYNSGSTGEAIITGTGSKWTNNGDLYVGYSGSGTLRVAAGGQVSDRMGCLGYNSGSTGEVIVTGAGSIWGNNAAELYVGRKGSGTLRVEAGGQVGSMYWYLGADNGSAGDATITGAGSRADAYELWVGRDGSGTLTVSDGGLVSAEFIYASLSDLHGNGRITGACPFFRASIS